MDFGFNTPAYNHYTDSKTNQLVAIERGIAKTIGKVFKKYKKAENIPDDLTIEGYFFILDEEYDSLKIDFETIVTFKIKDLIQADIS